MPKQIFTYLTLAKIYNFISDVRSGSIMSCQTVIEDDFPPNRMLSNKSNELLNDYKYINQF